MPMPAPHRPVMATPQHVALHFFLIFFFFAHFAAFFAHFFLRHFPDLSCPQEEVPGEGGEGGGGLLPRPPGCEVTVGVNP